ncbi:MAG: hypothetical protein H0T42_31270, partial [Deltaproteobacteria bacterium]|nr:hypothetical protein [Deltaproteobacteria bacterium]
MPLLLALAACRTLPSPPPEQAVEPVIATTPPPKPEAKPVEPVVETIRPVQTATPQELAFPDEEFRAKQPVAGPPRPFRLPNVKPFTLKNGIKVYLVEQHALPLVSIDLNFDGGAMV